MEGNTIPNVRVHFIGAEGEQYFKDMFFVSAQKRQYPESPIDTAWIEFKEFWEALPLNHDTVLATEYLYLFRAIFHDETFIDFSASSPIEAANYCNYMGWDYALLAHLN